MTNMIVESVASALICQQLELCPVGVCWERMPQLFTHRKLKKVQTIAGYKISYEWQFLLHFTLGQFHYGTISL